MIDRLQENVRAHDRAARRYEREHVEIFNDIEQERLRGRLTEVLATVRGTDAVPLARQCETAASTGSAHA